MLLINTFLAPSTVAAAGIGLFAAQTIPQGTPVYVIDPQFDLLIPRHQIDVLPSGFRHQIERYSFSRQDYPFIVYVCDNGRFINHSREPNVGPDPSKSGQPFFHMQGGMALRNIEEGEELFEDYRVICDRSFGVDRFATFY